MIRIGAGLASIALSIVSSLQQTEGPYRKRAHPLELDRHPEELETLGGQAPQPGPL
jgi:hypothetical protein